MADRDVQAPADETLQAARKAAVVHPPPPPWQNPEEPANPNPQNVAGEEVALEVCSHLAHMCFCILFPNCSFKFVFSSCYALLQTV